MKKLLLSIILILNCQFSIVNSQSWEHSYSYRYFGVKDGLSQSQIITSFQDSYGYMWFATNNGEVNRFDGSRFENWNRKNMQVNSQITVIGQYETTVYLVSMNSILFIYPDKTIEYFPFPDNYFYSGFEHKVVEHHLYLFNLRREAQTNVLQYALFQFDLQNKCFTIVEENLPYLYPVLSDKKIYAVERIIDDGQLKLYRLSDNKLNMIYKTRMEKDDSTIDIQKTSHNDIFGFVTKSGASSGSYYYRCFIENDMLRLDYIDKYPFHFLCVEAFGSERYLVSNQKTISILDMNERKLLPFPLEMDMVNDIWVDRDGNYWFSTEDGIVKCSRAFFESYKLGLGRNDNIWGVVKDSRNNVWFSSFDYGFWRADERGTLFQAQVFHHQKNIPSVNGYMSSCEDSHGSVFLPFDQGVAVFDPRKKSPNRLEAILTGFSLAVYHDAENEITFFGGESDTCITLNNVDKDGKLSSYPFGAMAIMSICRDGNANLRIGTYYGEALFDEKKNIFTTDTNSRSYTGLIAMALDQKGILWKGTTDGLFAEDKQGNDCQITEDEVLFVLNYHDKYIIWLSQSVLHILDLKAFQRDGTINISTFDYYDGFDFAGCVQNAATIDKTGFVWVAGGDKVIRFHPEQLMKLPPIVAQKPYLAAIYFADKNSEWTLLPQNSSIKLKNKENYLRFDILLACVSAPDKLTFRYRLEGYNDQWTISHERTYIFQNLPFGKYRLEVQASINGEDWSETLFSPVIIISNPFWLTIPGLLLILLGIAGITLLIVYYTRIIIIRKEEEKLQIEQLKHRAIRAKFIPHFTGNVLNSINYLISKKPQAAQKYISDFADFTRHSLLNSDTLYKTIREELDYTELYLKLEKLRYEEKLEYEISVDSGVDLLQPIPTMALQTFSENAIKHGLRPKPEGGKITIRVYNQESYIVLSVEDNGIGRKKAQTLQTEGTKEGLKIVQQQLDIFNKEKPQKAYLQIIDLYDTKEHPSGTRFELWIPTTSIFGSKEVG